MKNQQRLFALLSAGGGTAVLLFTLLFSLTRPLQAMSCNVSGGGSIQSAIDDVNCDTIIVAAGTFMENLNIGRSLTIQGAGASGTIIDGGGNGRVVTINGSVTVYLDNLRLTNGDATGESIRFREGGAIAVLVTTQEAQLMVNGDRFLNNIANASLDDFDTNEHTGGGAISLMAMNTAGRITGTITSAYMSGNAAKAGNTNTGEGRGGAIHARGATLIVRQSTIMDNISDARGVEGFGGGVYIREPDTGDYLEVVGSALAGNTAANSTSAGAQIHINYTAGSSNRATILHNTLADDTQSQNTALYYDGTSAGDELFIGNTIFANHVNGIRNNNFTGMAHARHLLFYNVTNEQAAGSTAFPGAPSDTTTWITGNPLFVDAANGDYHILPGSAAQDAGNGEAGYTYSPDVDGDTRPQGAEYDIGADELVYALYLPLIVK